MTDAWTKLYYSLDARLRPEDVAELVGELMAGELTRDEEKVLSQARGGSLKRMFFSYTSMAQDFLRPTGAQKQVAKVQELFPSDTPAPNPDDPEAILAYVGMVGAQIARRVGQNSFKEDRLNRELRKAHGLEYSKRQYNKRFRLLLRLEAKLTTLAHEQKKRTFFLVAKHGLAAHIPEELFYANACSACFVAYYTARLGLRSQFTADGQTRPFDTVAKMLLDRCKREPYASWVAIAHVLPTPEVLAYLSEREQGELLGLWFHYLTGIAHELEGLSQQMTFERTTMIVKRGDDSSTWNQLAGAWNRARDGWFAFLVALGMESLLDELCPGKVMRLMAADVAAWHRSLNRSVHPDTLVWAVLPPPWEVLTGRALCGRSKVQQICNEQEVSIVGLDGWLGPRPAATSVAFTSTPELVYGVNVHSPFLAKWLRERKVFSGKAPALSIQ
ncbi:hypothetical protein [Armatimonas sp.]|uniref:hypothetical protein n=1 Tax=Armatimonas sp. TaxID=1872638 RepID=UPI00286B6CBA|nr:hypothetical protein [Armatimonas sp.]